MTITNGYVSLPRVKASLNMGLSDASDDETIEACIEVASRQVDTMCGSGRQFWQDTSAVARTYYAHDSRLLVTHDMSTLTGLVVATDDNDDGTFETTLTINTDFIVLPTNAAVAYPVQPWTAIRLIDGALSSWSTLSSGRPYIQVTAKFGWSAVPGEIERATLLQAINLFKAPDMHGGEFSLAGESGFTPSTMHKHARLLLEPFIRYDND